MKASDLSDNESFRLDFVQSHEQRTHRARLDNELVSKMMHKVRACRQLKAKLIEETNKHHEIGKKAPSQQKYQTCDHIGVIDAACEGANKPTYSMLERTIADKDKEIELLNGKVCF